MRSLHTLITSDQTENPLYYLPRWRNGWMCVSPHLNPSSPASCVQKICPAPRCRCGLSTAGVEENIWEKCIDRDTLMLLLLYFCTISIARAVCRNRSKARRCVHRMKCTLQCLQFARALLPPHCTLLLLTMCSHLLMKCCYTKIVTTKTARVVKCFFCHSSSFLHNGHAAYEETTKITENGFQIFMLLKFSNIPNVYSYDLWLKLL